MDSHAARLLLQLALRAAWIGAVGCSVHAGDDRQDGLGTLGNECRPGGICNAGLECFGGGICIPDEAPSTGGIGGTHAMSSGGDTSVGAHDAATAMPDSGAGTGGSGAVDGGATGGIGGASDIDASVFDAGPPPPLVDGDPCLVSDPDECSIYCLANCAGQTFCRDICCGRSVDGLVCDGVCVNLAKDPLNCGGCGISCDAGTCSGNLCTEM